jgi:SPP1 gp7 family putative phage head morphogenesis protein
MVEREETEFGHFFFSQTLLERQCEILARKMIKRLGSAVALGGAIAKNRIGGLSVDWSLQNPEAQRWIAHHAVETAKDINGVTAKRLRATLKAGTELGESMDELSRRVKDVIKDNRTWRSSMIARTETMKAYNEGSLQVYKKSKVVDEKEWSAAIGACPICAGMDGQRVELNDKFKTPLGNIDSPPLHPNCRCTFLPIIAGLH